MSDEPHDRTTAGRRVRNVAAWIILAILALAAVLAVANLFFRGDADERASRNEQRQADRP